MPTRHPNSLEPSRRRPFVGAMWIALALGMFAAGFPAVTSAQSSTDREQARRHFQEGVSAAQNRNWELALGRFQSAYDLAPLPGILLNLAGAKRQTGDLLGARTDYRRYLQVADDDESRSAAEAELLEIDQELPGLTIEVIGNTSGVLEIDGITNAVGTSIGLNPGDHQVTYRVGSRSVFSENVTLTLGQREQIRVVAETDAAEMSPNGSTPPTVPVDPGREAEVGASDDGTIFESPWFWLLTAALVAGGVVLAVVLSRADEEPFQGNFGSGRLDLP